jgi:hypothetical protein
MIHRNSNMIKQKRKELIRRTKDKIHNVKRARENIEGICIICGKEIKKGQTVRAIPRDKNCQGIRLYHLRTCAPGSARWKTFKDNGKKAPDRSVPWHQLTFNWKELNPVQWSRSRGSKKKKRGIESREEDLPKEKIRQLPLNFALES